MRPFIYAIFIYASALTAGPSEPVSFSWIGPLTGGASILGIDSERAISLALDEYNRERGNLPEITLKSLDDTYDEKKTVDAFDKLVKENPPNVMFLTTYNSMFSVGRKALTNDILVVNSLDNDRTLSRIGGHIILVAKKTEQLSDVLHKAMRKDRINRAAVLYFNGDRFMPTVAEELRHLREESRTSTTMLPYSGPQVDFESLFTKIDSFSTLDGVVLLGYGETERAIKGIRKQNKTMKLYGVNTALALTKDSSIHPLIEGMRIAHLTELDTDMERSKPFLEAFSQKFGGPPQISWLAFQAYDAATLVLTGFREVYRTGITRKELGRSLSKVIKAMQIFRGVSGTFRVGVDGSTDGIRFHLYQIKNGKPQRVE